MATVTRPIPLPTLHAVKQAPPPPAGPVAADSAIAVRDLRVTYDAGRVEALAGVSFHVPTGQHLAILGASGSGKTTLLRCLSGRITPTSGRVDVSGRLAVIHQDLRLVKQRSALTNVLHGTIGRHPLWRTVLGFPAAERHRALELLDRVGLKDRAHLPVRKLSGGEQQRVAIARALIQDPSILLADEPVAALDENNAASILELLRDLGRERGLTIVSVLHHCLLAETYSDRVMVLRAGAVVCDAKAALPQALVPCAPCEAFHRDARTAAPVASPPPRWAKASAFAAAAVVAVLVYAWAVSGLKIDGEQVPGAAAGLATFLRGLLPSSWAEVRDIPWATLGKSLVETLQMSLIGTTIGVLLAWPMAALAAENVGPRWVRPGMRFILNAIRTIPSLIWALLFVSAIGFGPLAGVLALAAYSLGYLTKFFYEGFEAVEPGPPEALAEIGASGPAVFLHAVWPAARPAVLSSSIFMIEYNVRAASILGIVDAGGIGYYIKQFLDWRMFPAATACLLMLLAVVVALDAISTRVRAKLVAG